jgi:hypothetical protein
MAARLSGTFRPGRKIAVLHSFLRTEEDAKLILSWREEAKEQDMPEHCSTRALRAVVLAARAAARFEDNHAGPEHLSGLQPPW